MFSKTGKMVAEKTEEEKELNRFFDLLHICKRAGQLYYGYDTVKRMIRYKKAQLVLLAEDLSDSNKEKLKRECEKVNVPFTVLGTKAEYGKMFKGKETGTLTTSDRNFGSGMINILIGLRKLANLEV